MPRATLIQQFILLGIVLGCLLEQSVDCVTYYVRADNGSCNVSGNVLNPCFSLHQLNRTMLSKRNEVKVLFLQDHHFIPIPYVFKAFHVRRLILQPWNSSRAVEIVCQHRSSFKFKNVTSVTIRSLTFASCGPKPTITHLTQNRGSRKLSMKIIGCTFRGNTNAIMAYNIREIFIQGCTFDSNFGGFGGAIYYETDYFKDIIGNLTITDTVFTRNRAKKDGGAICSLYAAIKIMRSSFISNAAGSKGGAVYNRGSPFSCANCSFMGNSADESGGAIHHYSDYDSSLTDGSTFMHNKVKSGKGGAIYCERFESFYSSKILIVTEAGTADNNTALHGGFAYLSNCWLTLDVTVFNFTNNQALEGGVVYLESSSVLYFISGIFKVINNRAEKSGGGLFLSDSSRMEIDCETILFKNNSVTATDGKGGAVYFLDSSYDCESILPLSCSISYIYFYLPENHKTLVFRDNHATQGSVIYGGLFDRCISTTDFNPTDNSTGIDKIDVIAEYEHTPLAITSDPVKICLCNDQNQPLCVIREINQTKMRGEVISICLAAVDQNEAAKDSVIRASYNEVKAQLDKGESAREIGNSCSRFQYHIYTVETSATLILRSDGPCINSQLSLLTTNIDVVPCAQGFEQSEDRCVCDRRLSHIVTNCDIDTMSVQKQGNFWLRYDEMYLRISLNCPLDYCEVTHGSISLSLPDEQCANNRGGVLCGSCQQNFSMELGGSKCLRCDGKSRYAFTWMLAGFVIAGVALVALLLTCKLTTSVGDINGLIFYANIISVSGLMSLSKCSIHPVLRVFISWINLDLGIESCFYPGLDMYEKTWLQFVFPLYIWLLVAAITIASYYSSTAMRIFGRNNIAILATLFLLSYMKILKTITTALAFSEILRGEADDVTDALVAYTVWTHDGSVEYVKGKHIYLFVTASLFLVLLFLPYTLVLTLGQFLRSMRPRRGLRWVRSTAFVSIMDAYHAPYQRKHRYWTGFMLLTRCALLIAFATNFKEAALLSNMYATNIAVIAILIIRANISDVYKNSRIEKLELSFLLNLAILAATVYYLEGRGEDSCKCLTASLSVSLVTFAAILAYHAHLQVRTKEWYRSIRGHLLTKRQARRRHGLQEELAVETETTNVNNKKLPTTSVLSVLQLREPLLENT